MPDRAAPLPPLGATLAGEQATFRVWAPAAQRVELEIDAGTRTHLTLSPDPAGEGLWSAEVEGLPVGTRYRYRLDGGAPLPDPCSRFQPQGVHGPSALVDLAAFRWSDQEWPGLAREGLVLYELHVGTFSPEGTFDGVAEQLDYLRELGVTAIELMPVADFAGERNWGYDGVALYAPTRAYGGPAGLQRLVDAAHRAGLGVVLDVVYNHLGPEGNYLRAFSANYFTDRYQTPWGEAINYDGPHARGAREFVVQNAEQWLRDYHIDGLRLDATHAIYDASEPHILLELQRRVRAAAGERSVVLIAENEHNDPRLVEPPERGGYGLDAVWADDFHHAVHTALTGEHESYYRGYDGSAAAIARAVRDATLRTRRPRGGTLPRDRAVFCIQNHDQVG
ncbi:MAG TPA: alpha-amylase family glycosyl hydrolase, partial [Dehalococcoidia bacterium]